MATFKPLGPWVSSASMGSGRSSFLQGIFCSARMKLNITVSSKRRWAQDVVSKQRLLGQLSSDTSDTHENKNGRKELEAMPHNLHGEQWKQQQYAAAQRGRRHSYLQQ